MLAARDTPDYRAIAQQLAERYDLPFFVNQIQQESNFDPGAVSKMGARGIAQIMPTTAQAWGVDANDPVASLKAAAEHMRGYMDKYNNDPKMALAAYNMGEGNLAKYGPTGLPETADYIQKILGSGANLQQPRTSTGGGVLPLSFGSQQALPGLQSTMPSLALSLGMAQQAQPSLNTGGFLNSLLSGQGYDPLRDMMSYQPKVATSPLDVLGSLGPMLNTTSSSLTSPNLDIWNQFMGNKTLPNTGGAGTNVTPPNTRDIPKTNMPVTGKSLEGTNTDFANKVFAAVKAAGGTKIELTSAYRSPEHNRDVQGATNSNHMYGHAFDGKAFVPGKGWIPLGTLLLDSAGQYGLRSGAADPTFFRGTTDPMHVDDGYNQR